MRDRSAVSPTIITVADMSRRVSTTTPRPVPPSAAPGAACPGGGPTFIVELDVNPVDEEDEADPIFVFLFLLGIALSISGLTVFHATMTGLVLTVIGGIVALVNLTRHIVRSRFE